MGNRVPTRLPSVRNVIAVAAGKGGVGKSTVATNPPRPSRARASRRSAGCRHLRSIGADDARRAERFPPPIRATGSARRSTTWRAVRSVGFSRSAKARWSGAARWCTSSCSSFGGIVDWGAVYWRSICRPVPAIKPHRSAIHPDASVIVATRRVALIECRKSGQHVQKVEVPISRRREHVYYICPAAITTDLRPRQHQKTRQRPSKRSRSSGEVPINSLRALAATSAADRHRSRQRARQRSSEAAQLAEGPSTTGSSPAPAAPPASSKFANRASP